MSKLGPKEAQQRAMRERNALEFEKKRGEGARRMKSVERSQTDLPASERKPINLMMKPEPEEVPCSAPTAASSGRQRKVALPRPKPSTAELQKVADAVPAVKRGRPKKSKDGFDRAAYMREYKRKQREGKK
jgi:hypothetical protein